MTLVSHSSRRWAAAGALAAALLFTGTAQAAKAPKRTDRAGAERALARAQAIAKGQGVRTGRELTGALRELALREPALSGAEKKQAQGLLGRPTDPGDTQQPGGPYTAPPQDTWSAFSEHYCYHWVTSTGDAPPLAGSAGDNIPDYIDELADAFETSYQTENVDLGWTTPVGDAGLGGCAGGGPDLIDIYVKQIGDLGLYGYASIDPGQSEQRRHAFQVMDNDYSSTEFPGYTDPTLPMQVTAAHEYNHILQYAYDILEDKWMFESTATWMEDKVYPAIDDYHQYLTGWAKRSLEPLTAPDNAKIYGSAIWNHWIDEHVSDVAVKDAWVSSIPTGSFAPGAYDSAIRDSGGAGFAPAFIDFAVATAEWGASNSGIHEGAAFPDVSRVTSGGQTIQLPADGSVISGALDHTAYALFDVAPSSAASLELTGALPDGTMGAIALVGRAGSTMTKVVGTLPSGGQTSVTLANPSSFSRITAVIVNADASNNGFDNNAGDWVWSKDGQEIQLAVSVPGTGGGGTPGGGGPGGGPGTFPGGGGTFTPRVTAAAASAKLAKVAKSGKLPVTATVNGAGRVRAVATVDKKTAKKLGLGKKKVTIATGTATASRAGAVTVKMKLSGKAKKRLKKSRKTVKVSVKLTFTPASGSPATSTVKLKLKR